MVATLLVALAAGIGASAGTETQRTPPDRASVAGTDEFVSDGLNGTNHYPSVAVNDETGDILVVWQHTTASGTVVRGRLYKAQPDGSHQARPHFVLSGDAAYAGNPHVVWAPWRGRYVVVWDTFDPTAGLVPTSIEGVEVTAAGNPKKQRSIATLKTARTNYYPRLGVDPVQNKLLLSYTALPNQPGDNKTGIVFTFVNNKLKQRGKKLHAATAVFKAGSPARQNPFRRSDLASVPENRRSQPWQGLGFATSGVIDFYEADGTLVNPVIAQRNQMTWLITDTNGLGNEFQQFTGHGGDAGAVIPIPEDPANDGFGHTRQSMFVRGNFEAEFLDDVFNGDLDGYLLVGSLAQGSVDGAYLPRNYDNDIPGQNADLPIRRDRTARLADADFAHLLVPKGKFILRQGIKWTGPNNARRVAFGKAKKLFNTNNKLVWLATASAPELGAKAAAWAKSRGAATEVRLHIYE